MTATMDPGLRPDRAAHLHRDPPRTTDGTESERSRPGAAWRRVLQLVWCVSVFALALGAQAQEPAMIGPTGLSGGRYVGSAWPAPKAVRMNASLGYGFTEAVLDGDEDKHHRVALEL